MPHPLLESLPTQLEITKAIVDAKANLKALEALRKAAEWSSDQPSPPAAPVAPKHDDWEGDR